MDALHNGDGLKLVTQYLPRHVLPVLSAASADAPEFRRLLLPSSYTVDEAGRSEWQLRSRERLLADPVASVGYKTSLSVAGLRRPPYVSPGYLNAGAPSPVAAVGAGAVGAGAADGSGAPRLRVIDTARVRVLHQRRAKRALRGVLFPPRNWEFLRGLEERVRLVENALSDVMPLLHPVSLRAHPDYLERLAAGGGGRKPVCLLDLYKAITLANRACGDGGQGEGGAGGVRLTLRDTRGWGWPGRAVRSHTLRALEAIARTCASCKCATQHPPPPPPPSPPSHMRLSPHLGCAQTSGTSAGRPCTRSTHSATCRRSGACAAPRAPALRFTLIMLWASLRSSRG